MRGLRKLWRKVFTYTVIVNTVTGIMAGCAGVLGWGYFQSDVETRWTYCDVDTQQKRVLISGVKKWSSKTLFCAKYTVVIAVKQDEPLPKTPDSVLEKSAYLSCSYDGARNLFGLFKEQVIRDSVDCQDATVSHEAV